MKFAVFSLGLAALAQLSLAAPVTEGTTIDKRAKAATAEKATIGYASLNGGTTGGGSGAATTVSTLAELKAAAAGNAPKVIIIKGTITGKESVTVGSNKSILGADPSATLNGVGLLVKGQENVIIRNLKIQKVVATSGDAIAINKSKKVWIDHVDLSSDKTNGKDFYDGLLDITHACDSITVTYCYFHDHFKASLVGHSDTNAAEDQGHLTVTYAHNHFKNIGSRGPSFRFGTGHLFNNFYENVDDGINTRKGAQLLVQNNVFVGSKKAIYSTDGGFATASGNDFGGAASNAPAGTLKAAAYPATVGPAAGVKAAVVGKAGNTLTF